MGGAVYYSGFAAANTGHKTAVLPKADTAQVDLAAAFAPAPNVTVYPLHSRTSFVTKNVYHTPDRERRTSTVDSVIEPYRTEEVPDIDAAIWHLAGLAAGDIPNEMIPFAAVSYTHLDVYKRQSTDSPDAPAVPEASTKLMLGLPMKSAV